MKKIKQFLLVPLLILSTQIAFSNEIIQGYGIDYSLRDAYSLAQSKFALTNIKAAHDEFAVLVNTGSNKDFALLEMASKLAEYGFFDLSDKIFSNLDDYDITKHYIKEIKQFYYPAKRIQTDDLLFLAEGYSNIMYNNYAQEAVLEIVNNTELIKSRNDYTFYILALGYYEIKDNDQADNYISIAMKLNPDNVNYKILKTKILLEKNEKKKALKLFTEIEKSDFQLDEFKKKISALKEYIAYKAEKDDEIKDYHLGKYYYLEGKTEFAQKVLLNALSNNKKVNQDIYGLLGLTYISTSESQAKENAKKSLKIGDNFNALYTLGIIEKNQEHYKLALKLLNKASKHEKETYYAQRNIAEIYKETNKEKKSIKLWQKLLKKSPAIYEGYYYLSDESGNANEEELLKKSLSYNVLYTPAYYKLAEIYINRENFELAKSYLNNTHYIDENDFRYYYYLSQIELQKGNKESSEKYLKECQQLEPNYKQILNKEQGFEK